MPAFFEAFPVLLADERGRARAVVGFRRAESKHAFSAGPASAGLAGGVFDGSALRAAPAAKALARRAQLGEILGFSGAAGDGVVRSAARGWFPDSHAALVLAFAPGHAWHAGRALFLDAWAGWGGAGAGGEKLGGRGAGAR